MNFEDNMDISNYSSQEDKPKDQKEPSKEWDSSASSTIELNPK